MGQARQRGTPEQRKAQAEALKWELRQQREAEAAERERNLTPAERIKRDKARLMLTALPAICGFNFKI